MGHWAEGPVDELAEQLGGDPDRSVLAGLLTDAGREIEVLSGRSFHSVLRSTSTFAANGLPFVEIPDAHVGSMNGPSGVWEIPDPVNPEHAIVLQLSPLDAPFRRSMPVSEALRVAGELVAEVSRSGRLSRDYIIRWLGLSTDDEQRQQLFRQIMDPALRFHVPIIGGLLDGWWFQIARRLLWATTDMPDEGRLLELLLEDKTDETIPLVATEPVLIVARLTRQPVDWAFTARIWPETARRPTNRSWRTLAPAIHGHGIPTITIDPKSTPHEIACQVILKSYWHGYITGDEPALTKTLALAYPRAVERIRRHTRAPNTTAAAAQLLEQLVHPGFDPAQGAEATHRYVRRKASITVMEHRKRDDPDRYPWTQVGITERRFYKLLPLFADKSNGRYDYDHDAVVARMKAHLNALDHDRDIRVAALALLRDHGFKEDAARKWLQRHRPEEALHAYPRGRPSTK